MRDKVQSVQAEGDVAGECGSESSGRRLVGRLLRAPGAPGRKDYWNCYCDRVAKCTHVIHLAGLVQHGDGVLVRRLARRISISCWG